MSWQDRLDNWFFGRRYYIYSLVSSVGLSSREARPAGRTANRRTTEAERNLYGTPSVAKTFQWMLLRVY